MLSEIVRLYDDGGLSSDITPGRFEDNKFEALCPCGKTLNYENCYFKCSSFAAPDFLSSSPDYRFITVECEEELFYPRSVAITIIANMYTSNRDEVEPFLTDLLCE